MRFNSSLPYDEFFIAARGSGTVPGYFPAVELHDHLLLDGGIVKVIDVDAAIKECEELGYEEKDVTVDIVLTSTTETVLPKKNQSQNNPREMQLRGREIKQY